MSSWWDDFWGSVTDLRHDTAKVTPLPGADETAKAIKGVGGAMSQLSDSVDVAKAIWLNISDYRMWRSLGWLLIGIVLLIIGFVMLARKPIQSAVGSVASVIPK